MELVVLGGSGGWPRAGQGCSGHLVEHDDYRLLVDPGHGVLGELLRYCDPAAVDAVLISHGHLDHCADLVPLLRARLLGAGRPGTDAAPLPVLAPEGALDGLLALDPLARKGIEPVSARSGDKIVFGPLTVMAQEVRHQVVTFGYRITSDDGRVLAYTPDSGESSDRVDLARHAGLLVAGASHPDQIPAEDARYLSDAAQIARLAAEADVDHCVLTDLLPVTDPSAALLKARAAGFEAVDVARPGLRRTVDPRPDAIRLPRRAAHRVIALTNAQPRRASLS